MFKTCTKCNKHKHIDSFHNLKNGKYGKHPRCKICRKNIKKTNKSLEITSICCNSCGIIKPKTEFYKNKSNYNGYQLYCKNCHKEKIAVSMSKLDNFIKYMLKKLKKRYKHKKIDLTVKDIKNLHTRQQGLCSITGHILETIVDHKQRLDNIWNLSILVNDDNMTNIIDCTKIQLVCNLVYTTKKLYKLNNEQLLEIYKHLKS